MSIIRSMTGYASLRRSLPQGILTLDLKSVNNRYFEIYCKLPDEFRYFEAEFRNSLREVTSRGKFEFFLSFEPNEEQSLHLNTNLVDLLCKHLNYIKEKNQDCTINAVDLLNFQGVLVPEENMFSSIDDAIRENIKILINDFIQTRNREGERLVKTLEEKLEAIENLLVSIEENLEELVPLEREKLKDKIELLKVDVTPDRFEQEVALLAQKSDIAEEYDRIKSHIKETRNILKKGGICGKRLDFMMQEFNREANTMASKASNLNITRVAVDLKVLIEQMREQIQNIE